jgi:hypothetical protein
MNSSLALLGLGEGFSSSELHSAYRAHVRLVHPDLATSDADRARRTRETIRLNAAYAELRRSETPKGSQSAPQKVRKEAPPVVKMPTTRAAFEVSRDSILALFGAIVAGVAASTITGQMPLTVGVMLAGTLGARWAHDRDDSRYRSTGPTIPTI